MEPLKNSDLPSLSFLDRMNASLWDTVSIILEERLAHSGFMGTRESPIPRTLDEIVGHLATETGVPLPVCSAIIRGGSLSNGELVEAFTLARDKARTDGRALPVRDGVPLLSLFACPRCGRLYGHTHPDLVYGSTTPPVSQRPEE